MNFLNIFFRPCVGTLLCTARSTFLDFAARELLAQTPQDAKWQDKAEAGLKAIYDRGEFCAKNYRPTRLSDSSGFVTEEVDPDTKEDDSLVP